MESPTTFTSTTTHEADRRTRKSYAPLALALAVVGICVSGAVGGCAKKSGGGAPDDAVHRGGLEAVRAMPPGHPPIAGGARVANDVRDEEGSAHDHAAGEMKLPPVVIDGRKGEAAEGKALYAQMCKTCHGKEGAGGGIMTAGNLADASWQARTTNQQIGVIISHGKPKTKMPSFAEKMDLQKLNDLVAHIRTLKR